VIVTGRAVEELLAGHDPYTVPYGSDPREGFLASTDGGPRT
jgi:hypothetical protein